MAKRKSATERRDSNTGMIELSFPDFGFWVTDSCYSQILDHGSLLDDIRAASTLRLIKYFPLLVTAEPDLMPQKEECCDINYLILFVTCIDLMATYLLS